MTINMPKKISREAVPANHQGRQPERRFWLQVDRQTKASFSELVDAEKAATSIKAEFPIVQVVIYDAEKSQQVVFGAG
jgi:hypothetical protein